MPFSKLHKRRELESRFEVNVCMYVIVTFFNEYYIELQKKATVVHHDYLLARQFIRSFPLA
jgi:hypothetical protein